MRFNSLAVKQTRRAFALAGDIAQNITLTAKDATSFDFATSTTTTTAPSVAVVKGIKTEKKTRDGSLEVTVMLKSEDLAIPDIYDTLTFADGTSWSVVPPARSDGFVTTLTIVKAA